MLRMEKEHQVLQEQLKEASEKYEQLESRSSEETSMLEDELRQTIDGNKVIVHNLYNFIIGDFPLCAHKSVTVVGGAYAKRCALIQDAFAVQPLYDACSIEILGVYACIYSAI